MRLVALPQAVNHNILLLIKYLLQFTQLTMTLLAYRRLFEHKEMLNRVYIHMSL